MLFTKEEIELIHIIIQSKEDRTLRVYDLATRRIAESVFDKIMGTVKDDKYVDAELELNTQEKAFLITCIPAKQGIADGKFYDKIIEKIS